MAIRHKAQGTGAVCVRVCCSKVGPQAYALALLSRHSRAMPSASDHDPASASHCCVVHSVVTDITWLLHNSVCQSAKLIQLGRGSRADCVTMQQATHSLWQFPQRRGRLQRLRIAHRSQDEVVRYPGPLTRSALDCCPVKGQVWAQRRCRPSSVDYRKPNCVAVREACHQQS